MGPLLYLVINIYLAFGKNFWLLVWAVITLFSLFMALFYSNLIVPIFNRQTPLPEGELKQAIRDLSQKLHFKLKDIYVIDGSKEVPRPMPILQALDLKNESCCMIPW